MPLVPIKHTYTLHSVAGGGNVINGCIALEWIFSNAWQAVDIFSTVFLIPRM
jgi:hypothetical protein